MEHSFRYNIPKKLTKLNENGLYLDITVVQRERLLLIEIGTLPLWLAAAVNDWETIKQHITEIAEAEFQKPKIHSGEKQTTVLMDHVNRGATHAALSITSE